MPPTGWVEAARTGLQGLPGVGPKVAEKLAAHGLVSLQDLWLHLPLRYEDRTRVVAIADLRPGQSAQVVATVEAVERGFRFRPQLKVVLRDASRAPLQLRFFHFSKAQAAQFLPGRRVLCFGEPRPGHLGLEMVHPGYRFLAEDAEIVLGDRLDPLYPAVEGVGAASLARLVALALQQLPPADALELLPSSLLAELRLPCLCEALLTVHRPPVDVDQALLALGRHPAQQRLAFEELLAHQLSLRKQRIALREQGALPLAAAGKLESRLLRGLPFRLTAAQRRVLEEIVNDLTQPRPMLRLVQGDVGSGKTVVAALAALRAIAAGAQVALVAPTELLA
ncbi:MAG TPA: DEAD/DEAH box helicase, partial [Arenimonas sp.]|nr:DEAD/DEAH box helicase [Arenimonas sp.]